MTNKKKVWSGSTTCDICGDKINHELYDGRTKNGSWATMCSLCFICSGTGLGTGNGQKYIKNSKTKQFEKVEG